LTEKLLVVLLRPLIFRAITVVGYHLTSTAITVFYSVVC